MRKLSKPAGQTGGLDLGHLHSQPVVLDEGGKTVDESRLATREEALRRRFSSRPRMGIALETGTHSPWVSRLLTECGREVIVANSRKLRLIYENPRKDERVDAMYLARPARVEPALWLRCHTAGRLLPRCHSTDRLNSTEKMRRPSTFLGTPHRRPPF